MSEKDFTTQDGNTQVEENAENTRITLDSILKEYDAKKAGSPEKEEHGEDDADEKSEKLEAFEAELDDDDEDDFDEDDFDDEDDEDDFDDSDMKIASAVHDEIEEIDISHGDSDSSDKDAIMDAISHHFEDVISRENAPAAQQEDTAEFEKAAAESEEKKLRDRKLSDEQLKESIEKAFFGEGYSLTDDEKDSEQPVKKERKQRYDVNGERLEVENPFGAPEFVYEKKNDVEAIMPKLQKKLVFSCLSMLAVFLFTLVCIYMEYAPGWGLPAIASLEPGKTGLIFGLAALQILFFGVIIKLTSIYKGAVDLFCGTPSPQSVSFLSVLAVTVHTILTLAMDSSSSDMILLCSVGMISVLILSVTDFLSARVEFMSFRIASGEAGKYAFKNISDTDDKTSDNIRNYVPEDSTILDVRKIDFVKDFFGRFARRDAGDKNLGIMLIVSVAVSVIVGIVYYIYNRDLFGAFAGFISVFLAATQSCMMLSVSLPEAVYADAAAKRRCAFVGHDLCTEYDNVSVVSFRDTEVFPPKDIKVTNIHTYGDVRIDNVIVTMARIFKNIGGPLSTVFTNSISGINLDGNDIELVDIAPDGLWFKIDGGNAYLGTSGYMLENSFVPPPENPYEATKQNGISVLYLAMSNQIIARFSIKYTINPHFEKTLRSLYTQNVCARIKTLDPCINNDFIRQCLRRPESLFSVVKAENPEEFDRKEDELSSGLVATSNEQALLYAFLLVRKMKRAIKLNNFIKILASAVGLSITAFMLIAGLPAVSAGFILLLQIFWLFPIAVSTVLGAK